MDEQRITDHAEHCDFYVGNEHYDKSYEERQRLWTLKFAELIIHECIELCNKEHVTSIHTHANAWNTAIKQCKESIAKHFGVEE